VTRSSSRGTTAVVAALHSSEDNVLNEMVLDSMSHDDHRSGYILNGSVEGHQPIHHQYHYIITFICILQMATTETTDGTEDEMCFPICCIVQLP
jgi:hypothetical protein